MSENKPKDADQNDLLGNGHPPKHTRKLVKLVDLPTDAKLVGQPPDNAMVESVRLWGVLQPIVLKERPNGSYEVADGRNRIKSARLVEMDAIPAEVYAADTPVAAATLALIANSRRRQNPASDVSAIEALVRQGATTDQIREATGLTKTQIESKMKLARLEPDLRSAMDRGTISFSVASLACRLKAKDQRRLATTLQKNKKLTLDDVKDLRRVNAVKAASTMESSLFSGPATKPDDWKAEAKDAYGKLTAAFDKCPEARKAAGKLLDMVGNLLKEDV